MDGPAVDGRTRRRARNVDVVVDAMLGLLGEGRGWPSASEVAARAGLSERSVYRYFDDLDALARAAVETQTLRANHLFDPLPDDGDLDTRIDRLVEHRVALYGEVGPIVHAARLRAALHAAIATGLARRREQLRAQLEALFAGELAAAGDDAAREDLLVALEVATGFDALHALRADRGCSPEQTGRILRRTVVALLAP
jgi:TetR/AcrR family transcriptional regulator of autoinduction and epiphytic fitness